MRIVSNSFEKMTVTIDSNNSHRIFNTICIGPVENPIENDYLNYNLNNIFRDGNFLLLENDYIELKNGKKYKPIFYSNINTEFPTRISLAELQHSENERIFLFANIKSKEHKRVLLRAGGIECKIKVWINDTLIVNGYVSNSDTFFRFYSLQKGDNIVTIEAQIKKSHWNDQAVTLKVDTCSLNPNKLYDNMTKYYLDNRVKNKIDIVEEHIEKTHETNYEFMIIPADFHNITKDTLCFIEVKDIGGKILDSFNAKMYDRINYDLHKVKNMLQQELMVIFNIKYKNLSQEILEYEHGIYINNTSIFLNKTRTEFNTITSNLNLCSQDINYFHCISKEISKIGCIESTKIEIRNLKRFFEFLNKGMNYDDFIRTQGTYSIFYKSKLDNSI